ncbi:flagellar filament capping protein FliD [Candidatus Latescibacterota bacterium]
MSSGISFSGLGSGLDTDSIIGQLVDIERRPIALLQRRQSNLQLQKGLIQEINTELLTLRGSAEQLATEDLFSITKVTSADSERVAAEATNEASAGTFSVEILELAQARSLSSRSFNTLSEGLGLDGEIVINGQGVEVETGDSLLDVRDAINNADLGVSAQILTVDEGDNRLILTAEEVGASGFDIKDASDSDILQGLGLTSGEVAVKNAFVNGGRSSQFLDDSTAIGTLLGMGSSPAGAITVGDQQIDIDLATDSLNDIRDKIIAAGPTGVTASVVSAEVGGLTRYQLEIEGTADLSDNTGIFEAMGVLDGGGAIVDEVITGAESDAFTSTTTAVGSLLGLGGAPSGAVSIAGQAVAIDLASDSLTDIQTRINDAAIAGVTATVTTSSDDEGASQFRLRIDGTSDFADAGNVLESLGVVVGSNSAFESVARVLTGSAVNQEEPEVLRPSGGGALSAEVSSDIDAVGPLLGSTASGVITVGDAQVSIDLNTDSLNDIRDKINAAGPTGVTAVVNAVGPSNYELEIQGTQEFEDPDGVLEGLGVLGAPATATANSRFRDLLGADVQAADTVSILGLNHDGDQVAGTFTISNTDLKVQNLLATIEGLYGNEVTASIDASGRISLTDEAAGTSSLSLTLTTNNEGGGSLDFGTISASVQGTDARSSELQAGQDASLRINGITLARSSNTVTDAVQGVTLNLLEAEAGEVVDITVSKDDTTELRQQIGSFVADYNAAMSLVDAQFVYDEDAEESGPLSGDSTLLGIQSRLRSVVSGKIDGLSEGFDALVLVGITFDRDGQLTIDEDRLDTALTEDLDKVRELFVEQGKATDDGIEFIRSTSKTTAGNYALDITQAAAQASLLGTIELVGGLATDQTLTIKEAGASGKSAIIELSAGDTLSQIVAKINTTLASETAEVRRSTIGNTTDGSAAVTTATTFDEVFGAGVADGDTIRIQGTTHEGDSVQTTFSIGDASTRTVGDLLSEVRRSFNSEVSATIDTDGRIVITDNQVGPSQLRVVLVEENEGGGSLDLGSLEVLEAEGRFGMEVTASNQDGHLLIGHDSYGSVNGFVISQSADQLGLVEGTYIGADVAGTINGESATGFGRILTGDTGNEGTDGLALRVKLSAEDLAATGTERGALNLIYGVGRMLTDTLDFMTDSIDGTLQNRQGAIDDTMDNMDDQIASMERRVEQVRMNLVSKFASLEGTMATLQSQSSFLTQQLAGLTSS